MVIHKKVSKICAFSVLQVTFFPLKFVGLLNGLVTSTIISLRVTTESPTILFEYSTISENTYYVKFQYNLFTHVLFDFWTHTDPIFYSTFDLNYIFYHQIYAYISIKYFLLMFVKLLVLKLLDLVLILKTFYVHLFYSMYEWFEWMNEHHLNEW